jgi:hypothetical protein
MRHEEEWESQAKIHQWPGGGDQYLIAAARGVSSAIISARKGKPEFAHGNAKKGRGQHVTDLVEEQTGNKQHADRQAKPPASDLHANEDAKHKQDPASGVHSEGYQKSLHRIHPRLYSGDPMLNFFP